MKFIKGNLAYYAFVLIGLIATQFSYTAAISCVQCEGNEACKTKLKAEHCTNSLVTKCFTKFAISCVQCEGNEACKTKLKAEHCTNSLVTKCFTKFDSNGVTKGCLVSAAECTETNNCTISGDGENTQLVCITCGADDAECSQTDMTTINVKFLKNCAANEKKCQTFIKNKRVIRGCAAEVETSGDSCEAPVCNTGIFPKPRIHCYQCTGTACNDVTANAVQSLPCLNYVECDKCYTQGDSFSDMTRGCQSDDLTGTPPNVCSAVKDRCSFCSTDSCNNLKYENDPEIKCHQCEETETETDCFKEQDTPIEQLKECSSKVKYFDTEYCYTNVNAKQIQRGCLNDNNKLTPDQCKDDNTGACKKCTKDGCNSLADSLAFTCIRCRSDINGKCWNEADTLAGEECRTGHGKPEEGCFHGLWNGVAIRGCYMDADERTQYICKDPNNNQCRICNTKNCNSELSSSGASTISLYFGLWSMILITLWYLK